MDGFVISGKDLGSLALADACARCFWVRRHCALPFQIFPGIFSSLDAYQKKVTASGIPAWLKAVGVDGEVLAGTSARVFRTVVDGVTLTGVPDEMVRLSDGTLAILDYKTARFTANQDTLLPMYAVQLNSYALIATALGLGTVSRLFLVYYEPKTDVVDAVDSDGFTMRFTPHLLAIALDRDAVVALLAKAKGIWELATPPVGREGCADCEKVRALCERAGK